jgi:hypothetical protein
MSLLDQSKANSEFCKFIQNIQRVIGRTNQILERLIGTDPTIASNYSEIPGALTMGNMLLLNIGVDGQMKFFKTFIEKSINLWEKIRIKDDTILTEHLSIILPDNTYVEKIEFIYGNNPQKKIYVNNAEINYMWKVLTGLVHNSIKYIIFSEDTRFYPLLPDKIIENFGINLN